MLSRFRNLSSAGAALVAAALLASCDSGPSIVHFSVSNYEGCASASLDVDLDEARSQVSRKPDGTADCELSPDLAERGCRMTLHELGEHGNGTIFVTVDQCRIGSVSSMFSCRFLQVDLEFLNTGGTGCGCFTKPTSCYENSVCDVCASGDSNRADCEDCENAIDDDGDGEADCDDSDCELTQECGFGRTTLSCTSTTDTTATTEEVLSMRSPQSSAYEPLTGP